MKRFPSAARARKILGNGECFVAVMMAMASNARKSRKRKECYRAVIRAWKEDTDERDFIYFCAQASFGALHGRFHVQTKLTKK